MDPSNKLLQLTLEHIARQRHFPESTYRLQFHAGFTFSDASAILPYLRDLGITHVYASPYLKARAGSTHGYDVIDHSKINPEIGSEDDYRRFLDALKKNGLELILDIVPNHVGIATNDNSWWNDVLANGRESKYAQYFDIAWRGSPRQYLHDKILLPVLGEPYGDVLEKGQLQVAIEEGKGFVTYYDRKFPLSPVSIDPNISKEQLAALIGTPGDARTFDRLDELLNRQHYRLAYWRVASDEINYRRFFDINELAALCAERIDVFLATHELILRWLSEGDVAGLRIDHPDGLYDPKQYLQRLQHHYILACARRVAGNDSRFSHIDWAEFEDKLGPVQKAESSPQWPLYVVVEKILAPSEPLPDDWPVHGTSGYDFLNVINGLFVDVSSEAAFTRLYQEWTSDSTPLPELVYQKKRLVLHISFASELSMLAHQLDRLAQQNRHWRDFTLRGLHDALREVIACFPVYRSYTTEEGMRPVDVSYIEQAIAEAMERNPEIDPSLFGFIRNTLLLQSPPDRENSYRDDQVRFAAKFQQITAPVTAKGIEDTAFYVYNRLLSLNEVGNDPGRFGLSSDQVHAYLLDRQRRWPYALSPLSTHDTKRSEDVRARLNVLSELPEEWRRALARWSRLSEPHRRRVDDLLVPDANEECFLYQTLIGAWPLEPYTPETYATFVTRIGKYMEKALREAKVHTSWTKPNEAFESAIQSFISTILDPDLSAAFVHDITAFQRRISHFGLLNSLSQTLVRLAAPGVPDTYQGTELWDFSLVDPDNRRPVDYAQRRQMLDELQEQFKTATASLARRLIEHRQDGRAKLWLIQRVLMARRAHPELFTTGRYVPLDVSGPKREHVFAFARAKGKTVAVVCVPWTLTRLTPDLIHLPLGSEIWGPTAIHLPRELAGEFENLLTTKPVTVREGAIDVAELLEDFPVAIAVGQREASPSEATDHSTHPDA